MINPASGTETRCVQGGRRALKPAPGSPVAGCFCIRSRRVAERAAPVLRRQNECGHGRAESQSRSASFRLNLHLKDGAITDAQTGVVEGEQCLQEGGEIKCEVTRTYPLPNGTIRRHSSVIINRNTRELTLWLESLGLPGKRSVRHTGRSSACTENRTMPGRRAFLACGNSITRTTEPRQRRGSLFGATAMS